MPTSDCSQHRALKRSFTLFSPTDFRSLCYGSVRRIKHASRQPPPLRTASLHCISPPSADYLFCVFHAGLRLTPRVKRTRFFVEIRGDGATRRGIKPRIADERERPRKFRGLCHIWFCSGADHPRSTRSNSPRRLTSPERAGSRAANRVPPWAAATACSRYFLGSSLNR